MINDFSSYKPLLIDDYHLCLMTPEGIFHFEATKIVRLPFYGGILMYTWVIYIYSQKCGIWLCLKMMEVLMRNYFWKKMMVNHGMELGVPIILRQTHMLDMVLK